MDLKLNALQGNSDLTGFSCAAGRNLGIYAVLIDQPVEAYTGNAECFRSTAHIVVGMAQAGDDRLAVGKGAGLIKGS